MFFFFVLRCIFHIYKYETIFYEVIFLVAEEAKKKNNLF